MLNTLSGVNIWAAYILLLLSLVNALLLVNAKM